MHNKFALLLVVVFLTACQATTGHLVGKGGIYKVTCEPIPITDVSVNWGVFSTVLEAKNCNADNQYQERYKLANGVGVYQEANADYVYFHEITERSFREALARNKAFAGKATTIELHYPKFKNRITIFAQTKVSGKNVIFLKMNSGTMNGGGVNEYGWSKLHTGSIYENGNMSAEDFRRYFLERLRVFDTSAAASFIASNQAKKSEATGSTKTQDTSLKQSPSDVRPIAFEWEGYGNLIAGKIELNQKGGRGTFSAQLPNNEGSCTGSYSYSNKTTGTWAMSCTDGRAASGTFESFGKNKGSAGVGTDTKGRKVKYTIGAG